MPARFCHHFFIPMQYWAFVFGVIAVIALVSGIVGAIAA